MRKLYVTNLSEGEVNVGGVNVPLPDKVAIKQNWRNAPSIGMGHVLIPGEGKVTVIQTLSTIPQNAPVAVIVMEVEDNVIRLNGLSSYDVDGTIVGYSWGFNPSAIGSWTSGSSTTAIAEFTLNAPYTGEVILEVTDDSLLTGSSSESVERGFEITLHPVSATVAAPGTHTFTVAAITDLGTPTYQWYKDDVLINGATSASYTTPATTYTGVSSKYYCAVSAAGYTENSNDAYLSVLPTLPLVWFKFDDAPGNTFVNSGSLGGSATGPAGCCDGSGKLVLPVGSNKDITTGTLTGRLRQFPITWMLWAKPYLRDPPTGSYFTTTFPSNCISNDFGGAGGYGIGANVWATDSQFTVFWTNWAVKPVANTWYHLAFVSSGSGIITYVNGVNVGSIGGVINDGVSSVLYIGRINSDGNYGVKRWFYGEMDDVRIYAAALDAQSIATIFAENLHTP